MKFSQVQNIIRKIINRKVVNSRGILILVIVSFIVIAVIALLVFYWFKKELSNNQIQISNQVTDVCTNPKQIAVDDDDLKDDDSVFLTSGCDFFSYELIGISQLDRKSCVRISKFFIIDKNHVYKQQYDLGSSDYSSYIIVKEADPYTFRSLKYGYYIDKSHLYYDTGESYKIVKNVDISSIQVLSTHYLKDKNNIYFSQLYRLQEVKPLKGFDVDTFTVVQNNSNHEQYFEDKNGVYFNEAPGIFSHNTSIIDGADNDSFIVMPQYLLAKDKNNVYYKGKIISGLNALTFEVLDGDYYRDSQSIYTRNFSPILNSDPCTFELVGYKSKYEWSGYAKDKNQVYYRDAIVDGADPITFQTEETKDSVYSGYDKNFRYQGKYRVKQ